jgi:DNA repair protein RadA/Sms
MTAKFRSVFACQACGFESSKWLGRCPECGDWNTFVEERQEVQPKGGKGQRGAAEALAKPKPYADVDGGEAARFPSGIDEFDRVLGGGVVPGSLVLIGGEPGIGKSTLLLQVAQILARTGGAVLYVSGEESERQIKLRGDRLGVSGGALFLMSETSLENILEQVDQLKPSALVVDSVQTIYSAKFGSAPGSISQVREVAAQLLFLAKARGITTFIIGHVTKDGSLAGPKSLEHIVDTVLYFEGQKSHHHRVIRAVKNRFGSVSELGVFEMTGAGLVQVGNPSALFLSERLPGSPGSAVVATVEGTRPMLVEVQALVTPSSFGSARRMALGVDRDRVSLLLAVLEKRGGYPLADQDVHVSVVGGIEVDEPATDLGVAAAVVSSFMNKPAPQKMALFGEVGLGGELRSAGQAPLRLREVAQMGFETCVLPAASQGAATASESASESGGSLRVVPARTLDDALRAVFD